MAERVDTASRLIHAPPKAVYGALMNAEALVQWLPPKGMAGEIIRFEPREGGIFRMVLTYADTAPSGRGKTTPNADIVESRFLKLVPNRQIVTSATFDSPDPAYAGEMDVTWDLQEARNGATYVTITCRKVPPGIRAHDHEAGMGSTLENLDAFLQRSAR